MKNPSEKAATQRTDSGLMLINVGSVGIPYDGIPQACYCVLEGIMGSQVQAGFSLQYVRVPYDIDHAISRAHAVNMPETERYELEISTGLVHK